MKTLSKKLLTMLLAVLMLVSVIPMTAMAATERNVHVVINTAKTENDSEWIEGVDYLKFTLDDEANTLNAEQIAEVKNAIAGKGITQWNRDTSGAVSGVKLGQISFEDVTVFPVAVYPAGVSGSTNEPKACEECGKTEGHTEECSQYVCPECGVKKGEAHTEKCSKYEPPFTGCDECKKAEGHEVTCSKYVCPDCHVSNPAVNGHANTCKQYQCPECKALINNNEAHKAGCSKAPAEKPTSKTITLMGLNGKVAGKITITEGETVYGLPQPDLEWHKKFTGRWFSSKEDGSKELEAGMAVTKISDFRDVYYAQYNEDDGSGDGLSQLTVKARLYSDGKYIGVENVLSDILPDGTKVLKWLNDNEDRIKGELNSNSYANGYEWTNGYFYNYNSEAKLTEQDVINNGDKTVFIKLNATAAKTSKVLLYVHSKVSDTTPNIYEMTGYVKNGEVSQDDVMTVIKKHYSGSKMTLQGLYSGKTWKQLVGGEKPTAVKTLTIDNVDLYEVHVILTNASSNSKPDSSNPKTGDSIFMTVTVMAVSAIALAGAFVLNKKRMAK